jgi:hypothetical protein
MAVVVVPVAEGLAALAAAAIAALSTRIALETADVAPRTKERDCAETPEETECKQCKLGDGYLGQADQPRYIRETNFVNYRYQLYIANLHAAPERFFLTKFKDATNPELSVRLEGIKELFLKHEDTLTTTEWFYKGVWFDGFWRRYCTVVEAKGNYDWMFPPPPKERLFFAHKALDDWAATYARQMNALSSAMPRANLEWHFMQERSQLAAIRYARIPPSTAKYSQPPWTIS